MALKDLLKIKLVTDAQAHETMTALEAIQQICSLIAAAGPLPPSLGTGSNVSSKVLAAIYQDDDAHDTCSLTACLNPLHPGPCKGWKGTLHEVSPGAWHTLEAARVEKANHRRVAKIEALKAQGKPIPHKLLQPILPKAHPNAGQTAGKASGEAHEAGKAVNESAGVHNNTPGKVTLGQAIKPTSQDTGEKGPKGKKPTVASKGIAHVIAQEKVTPQYKLDKAAQITPEQWAGLSEADQSVIRGELAKVKKDGFGPQQKKADELLAKLPAGAQPDEPSAVEKAQAANAAHHQAAYEAVAKAAPLKLPEAEEAAPEKLGGGGKVNVAEVKVGDTVKGNLISGDHTVAKITNPSTTLKNNHVTYEFHDADGKTFFVGNKNAKATVSPKAEAPKSATPKLADLNAGKPKFVGQKDSHGVVSKAKIGGEASSTSLGLPSGYKLSKDGLGYSLTYKHKGSAFGPKIIRTGADQESLEEYAKQHAAAVKEIVAKHEKAGTPPTFEVSKLTPEKVAEHASKKTEPTAAEKAVAESPTNQKVQAVKAEVGPMEQGKPKPLPKHVTDAIEMAKGQAPGASWSKNHLAAYQHLSAEEYKALPPDVQDKIVAELTKGQSKFLDPKKVKAAQDLLEKFKGPPGAPSAKAAAPKEVGFVSDLHNHDISDAQAKKTVAATPINTQFLAAKQIAGLTQKDNPDAIHLHAEAADTAASALVEKHTAIYTGPVLKDPAVAEAKKALFKAAWDHANAESVLKSKQQAFSKIAMKTKGGPQGLSPMEKATLISVGSHMLEHQDPPTDVPTMDKLKADTKSAEQELDGALHAALKKANAPKPDAMSDAQIADRAKELLGGDAANPKMALSLSEMQLADKIGKQQVSEEAEKYPPEVFNDPAVLAKMQKYASISTQILAGKQEIHKLQEHITSTHQAAILSGKDQHGHPLSVEDKQVIAKHAIALGVQNGHLPKTLAANEAKHPEAKAEFHAAAEKAADGLKAPQELTDYDKDVVHDAYSDAWAKAASKAVVYGIKTYSEKTKMKAHPDYEPLTHDLGQLRTQSGVLAVAHAKAKVAHEAVPTDPDTGALDKGSPEYQKLVAALDERAQAQDIFNQLHKKAQVKLDTVRASVGLKKRALPKLDAPAVKTAAAETAFYKTAGFGAPLYGKSASAKQYMLAKVGPGIGVAHMSTAEKKLGKLGADTASTSKIKNVGEPVKLGGGDSSIAHIPDPLKKTITSDFKGMPKGKYLADPTEDIFDNLVNLAAGHGKTVDGGLSIDQVLKTIDETHSKNLGTANSGMLHAKVTDWLGTAAGKEYAENHSTPDPKVVKQINGELDLPKGVTLAPGEKVQKLAGPGPHDTSLKSDAFKAATASQAQEAQDAYMKASGTKWSAKQKSSLKAYTGSAYSMYNGYLRGNGSTSQNVKQDIIDIQSAMMPLPQHTLLKRGTGWPPELAKYKSSPEALVGKTFEEPGFTSTTVAGSGGHFSGQPLQLVIEAPEGTPAAFVNGISHFKNQENEMLLAAGTKFKVLSVEKTTAGHTLMRVRIVGDK